MKLFATIALALLAVVSASGQTLAAQSSTAPRLLAYVPGFGLIPVALDPSITITCPTPAGCIVKAVGTAPPPPALTQVICEPHPVTAQTNSFVLAAAPVGAVQAYKNGVYLMNIAGADYSVSGSTVTFTSTQTAQAGDGVCFTYQHQ